MKKLRCPKCKAPSIVPPAEGKRKWQCQACGEKFKITSKDAGKILRHADKKEIELGAYEPFLVGSILQKKDKKKKSKVKRQVHRPTVNSEGTPDSLPLA
jgi:hypothetical protein